MRKFIGAALATLAVIGATAAAPAQAHGWDGGWHGGWHHDDDDWGGAAIAGIAGLAIGAAIADSARPHYYYDGPRCRNDWRWDPYYGDYVPVRICR